MRTVLLVVHILAAATWIGSNVFQTHVARRFAAVGGQAAATWMASTVAMGRVLYTPAGILVLLSGVGLVLKSGVFSFGSTFVTIGFVVILIGIVLGVRVFGPQGEAAAAAFAANDDATGRRHLDTILKFAYLDTLLLVFAVVAMVAKWGI